MQIDEAFGYANKLLLDLLRDQSYNITELIHLINQFFLLQRGEVSIHLYDLLNDYLSKPLQQVDSVRVQSLFQQAVINVFTNPTQTTQHFLNALSIEKRNTSTALDGWDGMDVRVNLDYPVNIIITNSIVLKYKLMFNQLLLYNVRNSYSSHLQRICRTLDLTWCLVNQFKHRAIQSRLLQTNLLLDNLKFFINSILFYLSTETIIPLTTTFESNLPSYTTIDDFIKAFEDFIGSLFEKCFLMSDDLKNALRAICLVAQRFVDYVNSSLQEEYELNDGLKYSDRRIRRKLEMSDVSMR